MPLPIQYQDIVNAITSSYDLFVNAQRDLQNALNIAAQYQFENKSDFIYQMYNAANDPIITTPYSPQILVAVAELQKYVTKQTGLSFPDFINTYNIDVTQQFSIISTAAGFAIPPTTLKVSVDLGLIELASLIPSIGVDYWVVSSPTPATIQAIGYNPSSVAIVCNAQFNVISVIRFNPSCTIQIHPTLGNVVLTGFDPELTVHLTGAESIDLMTASITPQSPTVTTSSYRDAPDPYGTSTNNADLFSLIGYDPLVPSIGNNGVGVALGTEDNGYVNATRFTAKMTGTVSKMGIKTAAGSSVGIALAIYDDNSGLGTPGNLLGYTTGATVTPNDTYHEQTLNTPVFLTAGTIYWLATEYNGSAFTYYDTGSQRFTYTSGVTYPTFPNPGTAIALSAGTQAKCIYAR